MVHVVRVIPECGLRDPWGVAIESDFVKDLDRSDRIDAERARRLDVDGLVTNDLLVAKQTVRIERDRVIPRTHVRHKGAVREASVEVCVIVLVTLEHLAGDQEGHSIRGGDHGAHGVPEVRKPLIPIEHVRVLLKDAIKLLRIHRIDHEDNHIALAGDLKEALLRDHIVRSAEDGMLDRAGNGDTLHEDEENGKRHERETTERGRLDDEKHGRRDNRYPHDNANDHVCRIVGPNHLVAISRRKTNIEEKGLNEAGYSKREDDGDENIERLAAQTGNQKRNDTTRDKCEYDQDDPHVMNREEQALLVAIDKIKGRSDEKREHEEGHRE